MSVDLQVSFQSAALHPDGPASPQGKLGVRTRRRTLNVATGVCLTALMALAGCTTTPKSELTIDHSHTAQSQNSRIRYVVLHYTAVPLDRSLELLTTGQVSAHYLITDEQPPRIMQLVDESRRAWHAGISSWRGQTGLNDNSIGIEIVNVGPLTQGSEEGQPQEWQSFSPEQTRTLIALVRDIVKRHDIEPKNIVGHSDVAPQRKIDPGPRFPWRELAQAGLGQWFDEDAALDRVVALSSSELPNALWFQQALAAQGYEVPQHGQWDEESTKVLAAFQMHYRPERYDGQPDLQSAAILASLPDGRPLPATPATGDGR